MIIKKIDDRDFKRERNDLYKATDAIDPLFHILRECFDIKVKEDIIKIIIIIGKKYPSNVINNNNIKNSYKYILPSNNEYTCKNMNIIYILFKELIKEGIIKKGKEGSEIIEEILYIAEMINKKKDIINIEDEELIKEINDFIIIGKEKGFESEIWKNRKDLISEDFLIKWLELCDDEDCCFDNKEEKRKEKEKGRIKEFYSCVTSHSFDIQIHFIYKLCNILNDRFKYKVEYEHFNTRKNGFFLYLFLPFFFERYHFEEILPKFLRKIQENCPHIPHCYEYLIELYNKIKEKMMDESKELETNKMNIIIIIMFLWSISIKGGKTNKEVEFLINVTVKVLEWLGRIEEEKEEEVREKKRVKERDIYEEWKKGNVNINEMIICKLFNVIIYSIVVSKEDREKIIEDGRIVKTFLEIVKNHINSERFVIKNGNKKRIIECIIYSYNEDFDISYLFSLPSPFPPSLPFSHNTIVYILLEIKSLLLSKRNNELIMKEILMEIIELLNNYGDILEIINECDIKKEIEGEILMEWNYVIKNKMYKKISFKWYRLEFILSDYLKSINLSSFNKEFDNNIRRIINQYFIHCNNEIYSGEKEKEKNYKDDKEMILVRPFVLDMEERIDFISNFLFHITDFKFYSIFNTFYLINESDEGCNIINIYMKELSGEIVDRIKKREGNSVIKERRRYERERMNIIYNYIFQLLRDIIKYTFEDRNNVYLGKERKEEEYKGKEEEIKGYKKYISDIMEEENLLECLILHIFLKDYDDDNNNNMKYTHLSKYSSYLLYCLFTLS